MTWTQLTAGAPAVADAGRRLFYQHGVGLGFLATVRPDGAPRLHPICPIIYNGELFAIIIDSPKLRDLRRDGRYALHSFPVPDNEDVIYVTGRARELTAADPRWDGIRDQFLAERKIETEAWDTSGDGRFELFVDNALHTATERHGDPNPRHTVWRANRK